MSPLRVRSRDILQGKSGCTGTASLKMSGFSCCVTAINETLYRRTTRHTRLPRSPDGLPARMELLSHHWSQHLHSKWWSSAVSRAFTWLRRADGGTIHASVVSEENIKHGTRLGDTLSKCLQKARRTGRAGCCRL